MNVLIAPDSFKGALSAHHAAEAIAKGVQLVFPHAHIQKKPLADGGEGTLEVLLEVLQGKEITLEVPDALMRTKKSSFGIINYQGQATALIEMAQCAGLAQLPLKERNPSLTTSYGVGKLIKAALELDCKQMIVAIGGSATNDAGMGMLQALGVVFCNAKGEEIKQGIAGGNLHEIASLDITALEELLKSTNFILAADVSNPLIGEKSASLTYSFQKGADALMAQQLEENLVHLSKVVATHYPEKAHFAPMEGAGAAGGMGYALLAFLNATKVAGAELVMDLYEIDKILETMSAQATPSLVITGEGQIDAQTRFGKTLFRLAQRTKKYQIPLLALCGSVGQGTEDLHKDGFSAIFSIQRRVESLENALLQTASLLTEQTQQLMYFGKSLSH